MSFPVRNIGNYLSIALLAVLLMAIVPRQLWHHCEINAHQHDDSTGHEEGNHANIENNCLICDFQFLPHFHSIENIQFSEISRCREKMAHTTSGICDLTILLIASRGPPQVL